MAEKRMFSNQIIDTDNFIDMPLSAQALYFHYGMNADDDGFVGSPKKIKRMLGASDDDFKILVLKGFIIPFETGVVAIANWEVHNNIRNDRKKPTIHSREKEIMNEGKSIAEEKSQLEAIIELFNTTCVSLQKVEQVTEEQTKDIEKLQEEFTEEEIKEVFEKVEKSDFLKGNNKNGWKASFGWLIKKDNFIKIKQGLYDTFLIAYNHQQLEMYARC